MGLRTVHMGLVFIFGGNDNGSASNSLGDGGNSDRFGGWAVGAGGSVTAGKSGWFGSMPKA